MLERVLKAISRYNMLPPGVRVIAAVSGGADSVCLLMVLRELAPQIGVTLSGVAHFNHKLRGEESDADEQFVAGLAAELELPCYRTAARVAAFAGNLEQAARRLRRKFLSALILAGKADRIALGHTRDDQAETVLFRILRGSGLAGIAGIHPVTAEGFIRPLIEVTRADVEAFLRGKGVGWREDVTNADSRFARNRIRHQLLPQLARAWNPQIGLALAHLADLAFEEERWWQGALNDPALVPAGPPVLNCAGVEIPVTTLTAIPRAVARRVVRRAITAAKGDLRRIEFSHIERILELAARPVGEGRLGLPGIDVVRSFGWIRLAPVNAPTSVDPVRIRIPGTYAAPDGASQISLELGDQPQDFHETTGGLACANLRVELSWGRIPARLELRGWRPGDHYRPVGQSRDQNVKEMFQKARVPSWRRRFWPILSSGARILWARRFGAAAEFAADGASEPVLRISET
ncbi:MAG: tRNA lysidine(34) synthetase TilS [Bryobacteraceae bacterium]